MPESPTITDKIVHAGETETWTQPPFTYKDAISSTASSCGAIKYELDQANSNENYLTLDTSTGVFTLNPTNHDHVGVDMI